MLYVLSLAFTFYHAISLYSQLVDDLDYSTKCLLIDKFSGSLSLVLRVSNTRFTTRTHTLSYPTTYILPTTVL
ncbi:hypothetical protein EDC04DRAFT_2661713 [Pisolithus marmoratus]|nr:hypothetical protein EDC04DRAFT_2778006 [Pisolithus marmoratus]KAI6042242.1 hypothetical protein EDC04DRAFT_2661713 [Pisolithus marmoratus]